MPTFRLVAASAKCDSRKIKHKRRNVGTQALGEEAAKSGAGGQTRTLQSADSIPNRGRSMSQRPPDKRRASVVFKTAEAQEFSYLNSYARTRA